MTRNEIIQEASRLVDQIKECWWDDSSEKWALVGECERFGNDLCNAPTKHNRQLRIIAYTIMDAQRRLGELRLKIVPWLFENKILRGLE